MASLYWVGGTNTWNGTAGTKWATSSGGAGGAAIPTTSDDVFIDSNSGSVTVTLSSSSVCQSFNCNGFTGTLSHPAGLTFTIGGGTNAGPSNVILEMSSSMTYSLGNSATSATVLKAGLAATQAVITNGKTFGNFTLNGNGFGSGAVFTQNDNFTTTGQFATNSGFNGAAWQLSGHNLIFATLSNGFGGTLDGTAGGNLTATGTASGNLFVTSNAGFSGTWLLNNTITIQNASSNSRTFGGGNQLAGQGNNGYGTLTYTVVGSTGALVINDSNSFGTINASDSSSVRTITLQAGKTQIINNAFNLNGSAGNNAILNSDTPGTQSNLLSYNGTTNMSNVTVQDISVGDVTGVTGTLRQVAWSPGPGSVDNGNNKGWGFNVAKPSANLRPYPFSPGATR